MKEKRKIAVLPGDGIGPEIIQVALDVLNVLAEINQVEFDISIHDIGGKSIELTNSPLTNEVIEACKHSDAVLLGAVGDPKFEKTDYVGPTPEQGLLKLRKELGLYANIRPVACFKGLEHLSPLRKERIQDVDILVVRELISGIYFGDHFYDSVSEFALDTCVYNRKEIERILHVGFQQALKRRKKLTVVDKANVLETSKYWRRICEEIKVLYPEVEVAYMYVDNAAMQLIIQPNQFDVIVTENMFGDILSDESSVLVGSLGLLASSSVGDNHGLFEPIHGSFPQAAGKNIANPIATVLSVAMMLDFLNLSKLSIQLKAAVEEVLRDGELTIDLQKEHPTGTKEIGLQIIEALYKSVEQVV